MLPTALEYPSGDSNGVRVYRPARGGRLCEHLGGLKTKNLYLYHFICICMRVLVAHLLQNFLNTFLSERYVQSSKVFLGC